MRRTVIAAFGAALISLSAVLPASAGATSSPPAASRCYVSLSPSATETLFAIGAGASVEAVDTDSNYPTTGLPSTKLDPFNPNAEQIATICKVTHSHPSAVPDLVVVAYDANSIVESLRTLHVRVLLQSAPTNLAGAYAQMTALGAATGHQTAAARIVASLKHTVAADVKSVPAHPRHVLTTYYELDPTLYSLTSSTFVGQILTSLGVKDIADAVAQPSDAGYPQLNVEYLISSSPKIVFLADTVCCHVNATSFAQRAGFGTISAVRFGHVKGLNDDVASRWGPRLGLLVNQMTSAVRATLADPRPWAK